MATATTATPGLKTVHDQYPVVRCHLHPAFAFAPTIPIIAIYSKSESLFDFLPQQRRQILKRGFFQSITNKKRRWKQKHYRKKILPVGINCRTIIAGCVRLSESICCRQDPRRQRIITVPINSSHPGHMPPRSRHRRTVLPVMVHSEECGMEHADYCPHTRNLPSCRKPPRGNRLF